jgi:hypothetical protein
MSIYTFSIFISKYGYIKKKRELLHLKQLQDLKGIFLLQASMGYTCLPFVSTHRYLGENWEYRANLFLLPAEPTLKLLRND